MRRLLAALAFAALPGSALADCTCTCSYGQAVGICTQPYERPPICQRLCPQVLTQPITANSLTTAIPNGSVYGAANAAGGSAPSGTMPTDPAAAAAMAAGLAGPGASGYGATALPGSAIGTVGTGAVGSTSSGAASPISQPGWSGATPVFTGR